MYCTYDTSREKRIGSNVLFNRLFAVFLLFVRLFGTDSINGDIMGWSMWQCVHEDMWMLNQTLQYHPSIECSFSSKQDINAVSKWIVLFQLFASFAISESKRTSVYCIRFLLCMERYLSIQYIQSLHRLTAVRFIRGEWCRSKRRRKHESRLNRKKHIYELLFFSCLTAPYRPYESGQW